MFKTNPAGDNSSRKRQREKMRRESENLSFQSQDEFSIWLETQLDQLTKLYADFETRSSVRGFYQR